MVRSQKRLLLLLAGLPVVLLLCALLYQVGMGRLEGEPRSFAESVGWAAETLTTTGYGEDARWNHPLMLAFVVLVQFVGVFLVFLIIPIYLIPFLEDRFEPRLPRALTGVHDHVVVYRYGPAVEVVLERLRRAGVPAVVVERDEAVGRDLLERGLPVVYSRREEDALQAASLDTARAIVANGRDEENAAIILGARQQGFRGEIVALVEEPMHRQPLSLAGASAVFTPRHVLAAALAARASERISPRVAGIQQLGRLEVRELRIGEASPLAGRTLGEAAIGARAGATVIGQWVGGELLAPPTADMTLHPRGILIVVGSPDALDRTAALCEGATTLRREGPFVIAGYGEVGRKVRQMLADVGEETWVVDQKPLPGVDRVGNVLDPEVLEDIPADRAQAIVLALDSDDLTLFTTVVLKQRAPGAPVIARVNQAWNLDRIHRAGADFALSISQVSAQILLRRLVGEEAVSLDAQLKVRRARAAGLAGRHPVELAIRQRTGASVVAVERGDEVLVELAPEFRFRGDDVVYVSGSEEAVERFSRAFEG